MTIFAPTLGMIWKGVENYGLDPRELFVEAGIDPALRTDITARISERQADDLLWLAKQKSNDDAFVFTIVQDMMPSFLGALGLAWITSATLRKAFERLQRYGSMVSDEVDLEMAERGNDFVVRLFPSQYPYRDAALRERHRVANYVQMCRLAYGQGFKPGLIRFVQESPANASAYYEFFRCELLFSEEAAEIVMPISLADEPLVGFNPQLVQNLDQMIVDYLAKKDQGDIVSRTRAEILNGLPSGTVSLESVADALHMSTRSLIRKLAEENESFKNLLASIRRELGEKYVMNKGLSLTEISFLLGFSETSSFSRAYKNWTGMSPRAHRASL